MPCSCGNTSCPCGIPCCCLEESCKCDDCAIALHRFCKICNKPLSTDIPIGKGTCSCFELDSEVLTLGDKGNPQWRTGNIPIPDGYFMYGKLIVNMIIPIPVSPEFRLQRPINPVPPPPSIQTDSKNILPSDMQVDASIPSIEDPDITLRSEIHRSLNAHEPSSPAAQNAETSCKETCALPVLQSTDENKPANIEQSAKSEIEGGATIQESSLYLPLLRFRNLSFPVSLTDPVWRLPNPAFCIAASPDSSLMICNPFYVAKPAQAPQTMTSFGEKCRQEAPDLNNSNGLASEDYVTMLKMNGQPLDLDKIKEQSKEEENNLEINKEQSREEENNLEINKEQSREEENNLEINKEHMEFDASLATCTGNEFTGFSSSGNFIGRISTEEWKRNVFNTLSSNQISGNYLMHDQTSAAVSTDVFLSGVQELAGMHLQPAFSPSAFEKSDYPQSCSDIEEGQHIAFTNPQIPSTTQNIQDCFGFPDTTKLQGLFNMQRAQSFEENEYPQSDNFGSATVNDNRNQETDPLPLYIDNFTTEKMEKLLKPDKHSSTGSPISTDATFPTQNSDANVNFSNSIHRVGRRRRQR